MNYTEQDLNNQIKPLSNNGFVAFFQKIARWWLSVWYNFSEKHPKLSKIIYMAFFFIVFSEGVTIFQFLVMTFLPYAFKGMWATPFVWPAVALPWTDAAGNALNYAIFNEPVKFLNSAKEVFLAFTPEQVQAYMDAGYELQVAGLGNFIAFEIAVFLAQCINFPLQRNITYRSHGNPWYQAMWYFIGWVLVSIFTNAVWGIINPLLMNWNWAEALIGLVKTVLTGGVSMLIFFFIFLVIFPDNNKVAKNARAKYEKLVAAGASAEEIKKAENKMLMAEKAALLTNTEKAAIQATNQASAKAMKYFAFKDKNAADAESEEFNNALTAKFDEAVVAIEEKEKAVAAFEAAKRGESVAIENVDDNSAEENKDEQ